MGKYVKKTGQRRQDERRLSVRAEERDPPDYDKLTELLIRLALRESGSPEERASQAPRQPGRASNPVVE